MQSALSKVSNYTTHITFLNPRNTGFDCVITTTIIITP